MRLSMKWKATTTLGIYFLKADGKTAKFEVEVIKVDEKGRVDLKLVEKL